MTNLFQTIDTAETGSISKQQFNQAFASLNPPGRFQSVGASAIFKQLDPQGTGSVSQSNFVSGMTALISSLGKTGTVASTSTATPPSQSLNQSQQSLERLGSPVSTSNGPGTVVNELI